jgi:hypothetical protein
MRILLVAALLSVSAIPAVAQDATCVPSCALRIENRILGDRLIGPDGRPIGRMANAVSVQSAVRGVPLAETWAGIHVRADRRARIWGFVASVSTLALLVSESNGLSGWDKSDQTGMIWGTAVTGMVFGGLSQRQNRVSLHARGAALAVYNAAQARR